MGKRGFTAEERAKANESRKQTIAAQKKAMLKGLAEHYCIIKYAADKAGIDRGTHARWMEKDEAYRDAVMRLQEENIDIAENALMKAIEKGDNVFEFKELGTRFSVDVRENFLQSNAIEHYLYCGKKIETKKTEYTPDQINSYFERKMGNIFSKIMKVR